MRVVLVSLAMLGSAIPAVAAEPISTDELGGIFGDVEQGAFGRRVASGDLDGDGILDLAVLSADPPGVHVFLGVFDADHAWPTTEPGGRVSAAAARHAFVELPPESAASAEIRIGDLVGDDSASDDLVVSSPDEDGPAGQLAAGRVRIYAGPIQAGTVLTTAAAVEIRSATAAGRLGETLAVDDLDGDGLADLAMGEPGWASEAPEVLGRGRVWVMYGASEENWVTIAGMDDADVLLAGAASELVGATLEVASADPDGRPDLFISQGDSLVVLSDPLACAPSMNTRPEDVTPCALGLLEGASGPVHSVAPGQPNGGVWVGAPTEQGSVSWFDPQTDWTDEVDLAEEDLLVDGEDEDLLLGLAVSSTDLDHDGRSEMLLASPGWDDDADTLEDPIGVDSGAVWVLDGCTPAPLARGDDCAVPEVTQADAGDIATFRVHGLQRAEGYASDGTTDHLRVLGVQGRAVLAIPRFDIADVGDDAGAVLLWQPWVDEDGDGAPASLDCDDDDDAVAPGVAEVCNGIDDDCDGALPTDELDADGDGFAGCEGDCDDADLARAPDRAEVACNGIDDDCDGSLHEDETDGDGDGFTACTGDCDDTNVDVAPSEGDETVCNGIDDDCDGKKDDGFDADGDDYPGHVTCFDVELDCDDEDPNIHPHAFDGPEQSDADCDGSSGWPGGCSCQATGPARTGALSMLALLLLPLRRRRRMSGPLLLPLVLVAPLLQGQVITTIHDEPLVAVGLSDDVPAEAWVGGDLEIFPTNSRPEPDLLIGVPLRDVPVINGGGVVRIQSDDEIPVLLSTARHLCEGQWPHTILGLSVAYGDFDGTADLDLVAGAPGVAAATDAGWVFSEGATLPPEDLDCGQRSDFFNYPFLSFQGELGGMSITVADLDGDGLDDPVIADPAANYVAGAVYIFSGEPDFFGPEPSDPVYIESFLGAARPKLGYFVEAVDLNCDQHPEILTGGAGGEVTVLVNPGEGWTAGGDILGVDTVELSGDLSNLESLALPLPDSPTLGDGCDDALLSFPHAEGDRGVVALLPGVDILPSTLSVLDETPVLLTGADPGDRAGGGVVPVWWTADPEVDRYPDLVIGLPGAQAIGGEYNPGYVAFVRSEDIPWEGGTARIIDIATWVMQGTRDLQQVGIAMVEWMDRDGDGLADVVVSAAGFDHPDYGEGTSGFFLVGSAQFADNDDDGVLAVSDCDDQDPTRFEGSPELCDGVDNDCDELIPADEIDDDGDGYVECDPDAPDCDDAVAARNPGATEEGSCDGIDNDCDGVVPDDEQDLDDDGVWGCLGDCDPDDGAVSPTLAEEVACDGIDDDCDGAVDEPFDLDQDGFTVCGGDCDDHHPGVHPEAVEVAGDEIDQDCDGTDPGAAGWGCAQAPRPDARGLSILLVLVAVRRRRR